MKYIYLTCFHDGVNKFLSRNQPIVVPVNFTEQVGHAGLLVIHEFQELHPKFKKYTYFKLNILL